MSGEEDDGVALRSSDSAQEWLRQCLAALPLILFRTFDGIIIFAIITVLSHQVRLHKSFQNGKLYGTIRRHLAPQKPKQTGLCPPGRRCPREFLLAYWSTRPPNNRDLPARWVKELMERQWLADICWDPKTEIGDGPVQAYRRQADIMYPSADEIGRLDHAHAAFRNTVLGITVLTVTAYKIHWHFPINLNQEPDQLAVLFENGPITSQLEDERIHLEAVGRVLEQPMQPTPRLSDDSSSDSHPTSRIIFSPSTAASSRAVSTHATAPSTTLRDTLHQAAEAMEFLKQSNDDLELTVRRQQSEIEDLRLTASERKAEITDVRKLVGQYMIQVKSLERRFYELEENNADTRLRDVASGILKRKRE